VKVALDQVRPTVSLGVRGRGAPGAPAPLGAPDAGGTHQPLHAAATDPLADPPERYPHAPVAVGAVVGLMQLADSGE
jgi:hypothetical protein